MSKSPDNKARRSPGLPDRAPQTQSSSIEAGGTAGAPSLPFDNFFGYVLILAIGVVGTLGIFFFPIYFDEMMQFHFLYSISRGLHVHSDIWCMYPAPALALFNIPFGSFMGSVYVLVAIRFFCFFLMALACYLIGRFYATMKVPACVGLAICLAYFSDSSICWSSVQMKPDAISNLLMVAALILAWAKTSRVQLFFFGLLCASSILVMPKGVYVLFLIFLITGYSAFKAFGLKGLIPLGCGCLLAIIFDQILCLMSGTSIWEDITYSHLLVYRFTAQSQNSIEDLRIDGQTNFIETVMTPFICRNLFFSFLIAAGVMMWAITFRHQPFKSKAIGIGILLASCIFLFKVRLPYDQYLNPLFLPLLFFPALGIAAINHHRSKVAVSSVLVLLCLASASMGIASILGAQPQFANELQQLDGLQKALRSDDKVLAAPVFPPLQPSLMFVTYDQVGSGFANLINDKRIRDEFSADALKTELEKTQPALIVEGINFPHEWYPVIGAYLQANKGKYQEIVALGRHAFILKDRVPQQ